MAEPAPKLDIPSPGPSTRSAQTSTTTNLDTYNRDRERAQRLQEQKRQYQSGRSASQLTNMPAAGPGRTDNQTSTGAVDTSQASEDQRMRTAERLARRYGSGGDGAEQNEEGDQKKSKKRSPLNKLRQARSDLQDLRQLLRGRNIGLFGMMMFTIMGSIAGFLDILPIVTGDLASLIDWILDAGFFFFLFITMVVMTGDPIRSLFGFRGIINLAQTILEFIPISDIMPWHTMAIIVMYLDVKYDIVKIVKNLGKGGHPSFGGSETS